MPFHIQMDGLGLDGIDGWREREGGGEGMDGWYGMVGLIWDEASEGRKDGYVWF